MQVSIHATVLANARHWRHIMNIVERCAGADHQLDVSDVDAWEVLEEELAREANHNARGYIEGLVRQLTRGELATPHALHIEVGDDTPDPRGSRLSPTDAEAYLWHPVQVIVENEYSDGAFLELLCHVFARNRLLCAIDTHRLKFPGAGGYGSLWTVFAARCADSPNGPLRLLALKDGDEQYPGHQSEESGRVIGHFTRGGALLALIILCGRDAENYMTSDCICTLTNPIDPNVQRCAQSLSALEWGQRRYHDMETSFNRGIKSKPRKLGPFNHELERRKKNRARRAANSDEELELEVYRREDIAEELGEEVIRELEGILDRIEALL